MPSIRSRTDNNQLFFEFRFDGQRCREQTLLLDSPANRKKLEKILEKIESDIANGTFSYASYFPNSKALKRLAKQAVESATQTATAQVVDAVLAGKSDIASPAGPLFKDFANTWFDERSIEWRRSHIKSLLSTMNGHLIPYFGGKVVGSITKSDALEFRATLAKVMGYGFQGQGQLTQTLPSPPPAATAAAGAVVLAAGVAAVLAGVAAGAVTTAAAAGALTLAAGAAVCAKAVAAQNRPRAIERART